MYWTVTVMSCRSPQTRLICLTPALLGTENLRVMLCPLANPWKRWAGGQPVGVLLAAGIRLTRPSTGTDDAPVNVTWMPPATGLAVMVTGLMAVICIPETAVSKAL